MVTALDTSVAQRIRDVPDPEVPVLTIDDLGILRELEVDQESRRVTVVITPTYSGCPAMRVIEQAIQHAARSGGFEATVHTRLSPAWTTDWMSERGRAALQRFGIAPPSPARGGDPVSLTLRRRVVTCPVCGSDDTEEVSRFSGTACKALRRCRGCREPFEEFKTL